MTQPIASSPTSVATELADLLIQNETVQSDTDQATRDAARAAYLADAQQQVDALHAAAGAGESGALWSAAFTIGGAGCSIGAADCQFDASTGSDCASSTAEANTLQALSKGLSGLSSTAYSMGGGRAQDDDKADATRFEALAEQAKWQAGDASTEIDKTSQLGGKVMDIVQGLNQAQDSATNAVIGRI